MPPVASAAGGVAEAVEKTAWKMDAKYGIGFVALSTIAVALWFRADASDSYIRETMAKDSERQTEVITQNSMQLQKSAAALEATVETNKEVVKVLGIAIDKLGQD